MLEAEISFKVVTYADELGTAVTALGDGTALLDVKNTEVATGGLNNTGPVGRGVVAAPELVILLICSSVDDPRSRRQEVVWSDRWEEKEARSRKSYSRVAAAVRDTVGGHLVGLLENW